jgi:hypothetical protein
MAFTSSPQFQTYKTVNIKFDGTDLFRYGDLSIYRDLQIVNLYYERVSQENKTRDLKLRKRPGLTTTAYSLTKSLAADVIRGSFYDVDQNALYWAVNNKLYAVKPDSSTSVRTVATLNTSSGYVGFCAYLKSDNTRFVCATDGTDLWIDNYATVSCNRVTDADMPTPHQPYPLYIDGYLLLIDANTSDIWNSDVDDPTSWTAGNFISAEISSDWGLRLFKAKNYVVCLGYNSIEYFWDAGNESGSPFSRNDSPVRSVGYITGGCQIGDDIFFVGQDEKQNISIFKLNSFKAEKVSNPVVDRTLQTFSSVANSKGNVTLAKDGYSVSVDGHTFYVLPTNQTTWVYDIDEKFWYEWKGSDGDGLALEATWGMYNGSLYVAIAGQTVISVLSPSVYRDFGSDYTCRYVTEPNDFESFNWKICNRFSVESSRYTNTGTSNLVVSWSDDDWASESATRNINLFSVSPYITRLGKFRNRSFKLEYTDNYPLHIMSVQLDVNVQGI